MKITSEQKKQVAFVLVVIAVLFLTVAGQDWSAGQSAVKEGILRGQAGSEVYQETYVVKQADGTKQDIEVVVYPQDLTSQEKQALLTQAIGEFEESYLGDNLSADQVWNHLLFSTEFCQGMVQAQYVTSHPEWIWEDGSVTTDGVPKEGVVVTIDVTFQCQDALLEYSCSVRVTQPVLSEAEEKRQQIETMIAFLEERTRSEERFVLPDTVNGTSVSWHKKFDSQSMVIPLLGCVAVFAILQKRKQEETQKRIKREQALLMEYPQMVSQLSLLMGAGMNLSIAWERMVKRSLTEQRKQCYLEEMLLTYKEIQDGIGIRRAYENFGQRIGLAPYRKLTALLLQNLDKGNRDLIRLLDAEAELALEEQKNQVRRQGEEAGTKLLFPMLLLFVMVLIIIMIPAVQSF